MCYYSQTVKPEDIFSTFNYQAIISAPECSDQVEYLVVLDGDNPGSKACEERYVTDQRSDGLMRCAEQKQKADLKQQLTVEQKEDYSKVSGIYRETVLVIQKDSTSVQRHKLRNNDGPSKKIKTEITFSMKGFTDPQGYVATV